MAFCSAYLRNDFRRLIRSQHMRKNILLFSRGNSFGQVNVPLPPSFAITHSKMVSPAVRYLLETYGIDKSEVLASGRKDLLLKGDVLRYMDAHSISKMNPKPVALPPKPVVAEPPKPPLAAPHAPPQPQLSSFVDTPMVEGASSKFSTPHTYARCSCNTDSLNQLIQQQSASLESVLAVVLRKALEAALPLIDADGEILSSLSNIVAYNDNAPVLLDFRTPYSFIDINKLLKAGTSAAPTPGTLHCSLKVFDFGGVTQMSTVLQPGEIASVIYNVTLPMINDDGTLSQTGLVSFTANGSILSEEAAGQILKTMKKFIENPLSMGL